MYDVISYPLFIGYFIFRLLESITSAALVTQATVKALIASENPDERVVQKLTFELEETYPNSRSTSTRTAVVLLPGESKVVTLVNSLTHDRTQLIRIKVRTVKVMVSHFYLFIAAILPCYKGPLMEGLATYHSYFIRVSLLLGIGGSLSKLYGVF